MRRARLTARFADLDWLKQFLCSLGRSKAELILVFGAVLPVCYLTLHRGGVQPLDQQLAFGTVFVVLGFVLAFRRPGGFACAVPWTAVAISLFPLFQLLPFGQFQRFLVSAYRSELTTILTRAGAEAPSTLSVYPHATARAALVLAGCCALFVLTRNLAAYSKSAAWVVCVPFVALGLWESLTGVHQHLRGQLLEADAAQRAHGTFVNKNHFCALLEGCFGLALGMAAASLTRLKKGNADGRWFAALVGGCIAGALCLLGGVLSFSRAGIVVLCLMVLAAALFAFLTNRRMSWIPVAVCTGALAALAFVGAGGLADRFGDAGLFRLEFRRWQIWNDTMQSAQDYLWTGSGLGTFPFAFRRSSMYLPRKTIDHAHNDYLEWILELGLPATLFVTGSVLFLFWRTARRAFRLDEPARRCLAIGALLGAGGILLHAGVDFPLQIPSLAALVAVLLGIASGLSGPQPPAGKFLSGAAACGAFVFVGLAALLAWGAAEKWNAEALFARGVKAFSSGRLAEAERFFTGSLRANPHAAIVWLKRAELAGVEGEHDRALEFAEIAGSLEPHSLRVEWPLAQVELRHGDVERAARGLQAIAAELPKMQKAVFDAAWKNGLAAERIAAEVVPKTQGSAAAYLLFLADQKRWNKMVPSARMLVKKSDVPISPSSFRAIVNRLFEADHGKILRQLWAVLQRRQHASGTAEAGDGQRSSRASTAVGRMPKGFGWTERPLDGVKVDFRRESLGGSLLEISFQQQNLHYRHLSQDFLVDPDQVYMLDADIKCESLTGSNGIRLVVSSPERYITSSVEFKNTVPWTAVRLRFQTRPSEQLIRAALVRNRSSALDRLISGKVLMRNVILRGAIHRKRTD